MASIGADSKVTANVCPVTGSNEALLSEGTLADPRILAQPNAYYRAMRTGDPVHYDKKLGMWLVSRYEDVHKVLMDPITFSMERGYKGIYASGFADEFKQILERDGGGFFPDAIMSDPPYHTRIRKLLEKAFTPHRVAQLETRISAVIGGMIDKLADKGKADGVKDFAVPMTIAIICEQLGLEQYDGEKISRWSYAVTAQIGKMQTREQMIENAKQICDLQNYLIGHMRDREKNPREDMLSDLVHAKVEGERALTFAETVSLVRALLIAGNDTTATALSNLLFLLATQPSVSQQLYEAVDENDTRKMTRFVEELLRHSPPVRGLSRMTIKEVELGGTKLPEGAHMLVLFASANDDDTAFASPREFDTARGNLSHHFAFGAGAHRCIGQSLARMEIKVSAREIAKRLTGIKLAMPIEDITYIPTVATRTISTLPLTFSRR